MNGFSHKKDNIEDESSSSFEDCIEDLSDEDHEGQ